MNIAHTVNKAIHKITMKRGSFLLSVKREVMLGGERIPLLGIFFPIFCMVSLIYESYTTVTKCT